MSVSMVIDKVIICRAPGEIRMVLLAQKFAVEIYHFRSMRRPHPGSIVRATLDEFVENLGAAFVHLDGGECGFLPLRDGKNGLGTIRAGKQLLVRVTRSAMLQKPPRVSTRLQISGPRLIFFPQAEGGEDFAKLPGAGGDDWPGERAGLQKIWRDYDLDDPQSHDFLAICMILARVLVSLKIISCNDRELLSRLQKWAELVAGDFVDRIAFVTAGHGFDEGEEAICEALCPRVCALPGDESAGFLYFGYMEGLTGIDVNAGSRIRSHSAVEINIGAAEMIARQLRLRQIGGPVVIDFIAMRNRVQRKQIHMRMREVLSGDPAQISLLPISPLGLMELTRGCSGPPLCDYFFIRDSVSFGLAQSLEARVLEACRRLAFTKRGNAARYVVSMAPQLRSWLGCNLEVRRELSAVIGEEVVFRSDKSCAIEVPVLSPFYG